MIAIFRKELADYLTSARFLILLGLVLFISALTLYAAYEGIRGTGSGGFVFLKLFSTEASGIPFAFLFSFINFTALFFVPLIGIALGFDAINREHSSGTMSRILAQPIFRDSVINGKFLAGIVTLAIMMTAAILIVSGLGLRMIGVPPTSEEAFRLLFYLVLTIIYGAFWMGLAILFSVLFGGISTSLLSSIFLWLFLSFGMLVVVQIVETPQMVLWFSPNLLFAQATSVLLYPAERIVGTITASGANIITLNPPSFGQSMLLIWPHLTSLISLSIICFAISYVVFMRREIRAT